MTIDTSVPASNQDPHNQNKSTKKDRRHQSVTPTKVGVECQQQHWSNVSSSQSKLSIYHLSAPTQSELSQCKLTTSSVSTLVSSSIASPHFMSPMMTSSVPSADHGGLLTLGHTAHLRQFGHSLPQIGSHLSAFNHLNLKHLDTSRPPSGSSSEAAEERPKSRRTAISPFSSVSSPSPNHNLMHSNEKKTRPDSDSEIEVDDESDERKKRFKKRTNSDISGKLSHTASNLSSSFFINDILKNSTSASSDLHNAFLRSHPHLSPPSTPPSLPHPFSVQDLTVQGLRGSVSQSTGQHPAYAMFAAAVAAVAGKQPNDPSSLAGNLAAAHQQQTVAVGNFFGHQNQIPHTAATLGAIRHSPFGIAPLGALGLGAHDATHPPSATITGDSDPEMDADDEDGCSSTEGDDDRKLNGK